MIRSAFLATMLAVCGTYAAEQSDVKQFIGTVIQSYLDGKQEPSFKVADRVFAIDNGEVLSKGDFEKAWPEFCKIAFKRKISLEDYFEGANLEIVPASEKGTITRNKRLRKVYSYREGDLFVDGSAVKAGVDDFIRYKKAFVFVIRKMDGRWTLIGIGG